MKILVACECSGRVREALRAKGHDAWSCDLQPAEDDPTYHICGDVLPVLNAGWDGMVAHPPCTRLANSGVRWLRERDLWSELEEACEFYLKFRNAPIALKAIENPVMHGHATKRIGKLPRQIVQPWWFGDPYFKATGFELHGLPQLIATNKLTPPIKGTEEHKKWSECHRASPGPQRAVDRSRTYPGIAAAIANQWFK